MDKAKEIKTVLEEESFIEKNWLEINHFLKAYPNVTLLGVIKSQPTYRIKKAIHLGLNHLGVNYLQEGLIQQKELVSHSHLCWHFIGHIQSNKIKKIISSFDYVDSVSRIKIIEALIIEKKKTKVLLEINAGEEAQKSGFLEKEVASILKKTTSIESNIKILGFMVVIPQLDSDLEKAKHFKRVKNIYDQLSKDYELTRLSMGTSDDYQIALQEGSTEVRLGHILFGAREKRM